VFQLKFGATFSDGWGQSSYPLLMFTTISLFRDLLKGNNNKKFRHIIWLAMT
jgi:hypothetical protein